MCVLLTGDGDFAYIEKRAACFARTVDLNHTEPYRFLHRKKPEERLTIQQLRARMYILQKYGNYSNDRHFIHFLVKEPKSTQLSALCGTVK